MLPAQHCSLGLSWTKNLHKANKPFATAAVPSWPLRMPALVILPCSDEVGIQQIVHTTQHGPQPNKPSTHLPPVLRIRMGRCNHNSAPQRKTSTCVNIPKYDRNAKKHYLRLPICFPLHMRLLPPFWKARWSAGLAEAGPPRRAARQPALLWPH